MGPRNATILAATALVIVAFVVSTASALALPAYASATGQPCSACHTSALGGGPLNAQGQAFAAIPTHAANPAAAWAQVTAPTKAPAPAAPAPAAPAPAAPAPAAPAPGAAPAAPAAGAAPGALPTTGEAAAASLLPLALALLGAAAGGAGLRLRRHSKDGPVS